MRSDANLSLELQSGIAIFNPIPKEYAISQEGIEIVIAEAVQECDRLGIRGKDVTPFLLKRVAERTKGQSLSANVTLIENNARVGAGIALALASLEGQKSTFQPPLRPEHPVANSTPRESVTDIMVIGSMAVDLTCTLQSTTLKQMTLQTSLPAHMHTSVGGVAHNVALAASYASSRPVRLITAIGADPEARWLRQYAQNAGFDVSFISGSAETARYVAIHDREGELVTAAADMKVIEGLRDEDVRMEIVRGKPKFLAFDGNISPQTVNTILQTIKESDTTGILSLSSVLMRGLMSGTIVLFEPTSVPKARIVFENPVELGLFPNHSVDIITPNIFELKAMYEAAGESGFFENSEWWVILDSFGITSQFRHGIFLVVRLLLKY